MINVVNDDRNDRQRAQPVNVGTMRPSAFVRGGELLPGALGVGRGARPLVLPLCGLWVSALQLFEEGEPLLLVLDQRCGRHGQPRASIRFLSLPMLSLRNILPFWR
eukprot:1164880-Prymnesium_polylepis.1